MCAYAVLGFGVPGFCIWVVVGPQRSLLWALIYAASITLFGGLGQSWRLNWDRNGGKL